MSTLVFASATRSTMSITLRIAALLPTSRPDVNAPSSVARSALFSPTICRFSSAFSSSASSSWLRNGFWTKSYAPRRIASTACSVPPYAVIIRTCVVSSRSRAALSTSMPLPSGSARSVTTAA